MELHNNEVISNNESEPGERKDCPPTEQNLSAAYASVYTGVVANDQAVVGSEDSESLDSVEEVLGDEQNSEEVVGDPEQSEEVVGGQDHPLLLGQDHPPLLGQDHPPLLGQDHPPLLGQEHPLLLGQDHPPLLGQEHPPLLGHDHPPLQGEDHPPLQGQDHPPLQGQDHPPLQGQDQPPLQGQDQPPLQGQDQPPLQGQDQPPLQGQDQPLLLHAMLAIQRALQGLRHGQQGNRIAQPPEAAQFHASMRHPPGIEVVLSKLLYNIQLLEDQEYPFSMRAYANSMSLMGMHFEDNECVPLVLMRLFLYPDQVNKWLEFDLFCVHTARFYYLHRRGRGPEMNVFPVCPLYKEDLEDFFRLYPRYK